VVASISKNFKELLEDARQNPGNSIYGWPQMRDEADNSVRLCLNSKCIDLAFVKYVPDKDHF
jgi:hypothetical protein